MTELLHGFNRRDAVMTAVLLAVSLALCGISLRPSTDPEPGSKEKAVVISVDNSGVDEFGLVRRGTQQLQVKVLSGKFKGRVFNAVNELRSQMELDKLFVPGDKILAGILHDAVPEVTVINAQDYYRFTPALWLFAIFALLLLVFGGSTGFNALLSFVVSCQVIWKVVVPLCLRNWNAVAVSLVAVAVLTFIIIFLVAGARIRRICGSA